MNDKIEGIVLSSQDYRDNDLLLQVLSKQYGVLSLIGKAAKKLSSKNHFLPFCRYEFMIDYRDGKTIYTIHSHKLLASYFVDSDIEMMTFENILAEITLKNKEIETYDELCFVFEHLNKDNRYLLGSMYLSHLIRRFGIEPIVDKCALCDNKKVVAISNNHGGFLCEKHLGGEKILPVENLRRFRLMIKGRFDNYDVLKDIEYVYRDFALLMDFFLSNTDLRLKSYDFYKTIV